MAPTRQRDPMFSAPPKRDKVTAIVHSDAMFSAPDRGGRSKTAKPKNDGGGGLLHTIEHAVTKGAANLRDAARSSPAALAHAGEAAGRDLLDTITLQNVRHPEDRRSRLLDEVLIPSAKQTAQDLRHPLRNPGYTALDVLGIASLGAGTAARVGAAGKALSETGKVSKAARALVEQPKPGERTLKVGDLEARGHYSRSALSRGVQKTVDKTLERGAQIPNRGRISNRAGVIAENRLHKRASKWLEREARVADAKARSTGTRLQALGSKLKPEELRALRLVAEEVPVARRVGAQEMRAARSSSAKEAKRHRERIDLTRKALDFLDEGPDGKPILKPQATKLRKVYGLLEQASRERGGILKQLDLLDEAAQQAAKTNAARVAAGATFVKDTLADRVAKTPERFKPQLAESLAGRYVKAADRANFGQVVSVDLDAGTARVHFKNKTGAKATVTLPLDKLTSTTSKSGRIVGAEDITVSPEAPFIGNPVERTRIRGRPKVSSTGTFGHTPKPSSLKRATGAAVEHALERGDVTNIVAERHREATRLANIHRRSQQLAKAGEPTPRRRDDVFVWTDKTVSQERIPKEVRRYLDNPEGLARLSPDEQTGVIRTLKDALLERHNWEVDPEARAEFEALAAEGKGVFVPRRLMGNLAKDDYSFSGVLGKTGMRFFDAVNNAQKAGLIYLKLNYPVIQGISNVAMNLIQQGPFAIPNLTRAVTLERKLGPAGAAVIDDIMGQGAVLQAAFEGQGAVSRATQKLAHAMTSKVDTPSRRAAWLHEAIRKGYDTPEKWARLIEDDSKLGDLVEVTQRAKEAIVDYGELSPWERQIIRRVVFVYPWQKGATKYAGHFVRDHPVQAAALGMAGEQGRQRQEQAFGELPSYLRDLIPVGGRAINPAGVNFFQTPSQIGEAIAGLATGSTASPTGAGFLSPPFGIALGLATGRDDLGFPVRGGFLQRTRDLTLAQTPIASLARAFAEGHSGGSAAGRAGDTARVIFGTRKPSHTFPDSLTLQEALGRFTVGGLYPRRYNRAALNQNAARERAGR